MVKPAFHVVLHLQGPNLQCSPLSRVETAFCDWGQDTAAPTFLDSAISTVRELLKNSFVDFIRICSKVSVELNSPGPDVFRTDRIGVDDIGLGDFWAHNL